MILVDDGLATGVTARAARRHLRRQGPNRLILAVPVCASGTADLMRREADDVSASTSRASEPWASGMASFTSNSSVCLPVWAAVGDLEARGCSREIAASPWGGPPPVRCLFLNLRHRMAR
ncbi:phosphoribosyltransferase family protein [Streptomyces sp. TRM70350]|uniref:phosphoribosyltransferase family protein n=1 Tax=Streptomyces sp. TRM70350 TaxID=2856165 RepID=UPI0027E02C9C|nr:phosphoribosyltransferase family protein [Streptomyces sp. TRM70350]